MTSDKSLRSSGTESRVHENIYIYFAFALNVTDVVQTFSWLFGSHDHPLTRQRISRSTDKSS